MAKPFQGLTIALSGDVGMSHMMIESSIKEFGGQYSKKVDKSCTHLLTSVKDFISGKNKVKQAQDLGNIKIVHPDWFAQCFATQMKCDETSYLLENDYIGNSKRKMTQKLVKKRAHSSSPGNPDSSAQVTEGLLPVKKHKEEQKATVDSVHIPLDNGVTVALGSSYRVYIDGEKTILDATLTQTNVGQNNNKFYRIQVLASTARGYQTWTRWGRVGGLGQSQVLGDGSLEDAVGFFHKKFKDKSGHLWANRLDTPKAKKYAFLERKYEGNGVDDEEPEERSLPSEKRKGTDMSIVVGSQLPEPTQNLMRMIFNRQYFAQTMSEMSYDADKLPLKDLSKRTLDRGFKILKDIADLMYESPLADEKTNMTYSDAIEELSNAFYTAIPHSFGRSRAPLISSEQRLLQEVRLLESLVDMEIAGKIMQNSEGNSVVSKLEHQFAGLNLQEMTPLDPSAKEYTELEAYLLRSHGATHSMRFKVQDIFRIKRNEEDERFRASPFFTLQRSDRRLLWHGSRCTNFAGILSQGLRIAPPEAPVNGYAFGKGVYLADISSKSANYCCPWDSGNSGLILLCEAELGNPKLERFIGFDHPDYPALVKSKGCVSTWGKGATAPAAWKDASCVHPDLLGVKMPDMRQDLKLVGGVEYPLLYNEYIVYDTAQVRLRYLLRVDMRES